MVKSSKTYERKCSKGTEDRWTRTPRNTIQTEGGDEYGHGYVSSLRISTCWVELRCLQG